eukprot:1127565-Pleurochrysis_carterae.AAC.1
MTPGEYKKCVGKCKNHEQGAKKAEAIHCFPAAELLHSFVWEQVLIFTKNEKYGERPSAHHQKLRLFGEFVRHWQGEREVLHDCRREQRHVGRCRAVVPKNLEHHLLACRLRSYQPQD